MPQTVNQLWLKFLVVSLNFYHSNFLPCFSLANGSDNVNKYCQMHMLNALMFSPSVLVVQEPLTTLQGHPILLRSILTNCKDNLTMLLIRKYNGGTYNIILTVALSSELMDGLRNALSP